MKTLITIAVVIGAVLLIRYLMARNAEKNNLTQPSNRTASLLGPTVNQVLSFLPGFPLPVGSSSGVTPLDPVNGSEKAWADAISRLSPSDKAIRSGDLLPPTKYYA